MRILGWALVVLASGRASADLQHDVEAQLTSTLSSVERSCGVKVTAKLDPKDLPADLQEKWSSSQAASSCNTFIGALGAACSNWKSGFAYKKAVARNVSSVVCSFAPGRLQGGLPEQEAGTRGHMRLANHTFSYAMGVDDVNLGEMASQVLVTALDEATPDPTNGLTPSQEVAQKEFDESMAAILKHLEESCGAKPAVKVDFRKFAWKKLSGAQIGSHCGGAVGAFSHLCSSGPEYAGPYKRAFAQELKEVTCSFDGVAPAATEEATRGDMSFDGHHFVFKLHQNNHVNVGESAEKVIQQVYDEPGDAKHPPRWSPAPGTLRPAQETARQKFDGKLKGAVADLDAACGTHVKLTTDFENYSEAHWGNWAVASFCAGPLSALEEACGDPARKKTLSRDLKEVRCLVGGTLPGHDSKSTLAGTEANMSYARGVFTFKMAPDSPNVGAIASKVLAKALGPGSGGGAKRGSNRRR